ncbi:hypothetical protein L9F63_015368 [Diploptera punctata]|uniref:Glucose-methanol-choline oxidoreductase N-terminal domain-containing protein n=1 Tax=Diploptera punctata TaxID=6984 RepID=A0AAD8A619_DIPPU|nr:hypothetical protein L9F63_015368 [Diploptera punctata]
MKYEILTIALIVYSRVTKIETKNKNTNFLNAIGKFIIEWNKHAEDEPSSKEEVLPEHDFIIVGAGSAGCVLANRLTEVEEWNVLLMEAGNQENYLFDILILAPYIHFTDTNWNFKSERSNVWEWVEMGNPGWGWKDVLPLFMNIENMLIPKLAKDKYHSTKGNLPISYPSFRSELGEAFIKAGKK